ncbi:DUF2917 domain-containing protein [Massilia endophytica]|uniref:DUF2917 domain-containing protein n=1 Tax=Massilia endophytica TaxID=2899220 RepID=UPI001E62FC6C|nr:DUF2917 domain-containing protein [Massilia endophytica]UGQ46422.1 DUF2917 domain-containing protein [Massilia endophytica]
MDKENAMLTMHLTLQPGQAASFTPDCATRLRCLEGMLWLVRDRDTEDKVLEAGDSLQLPGAARHVLSSVGRNEPVTIELAVPFASGGTALRPRWLAHCLRQFL